MQEVAGFSPDRATKEMHAWAKISRTFWPSYWHTQMIFSRKLKELAIYIAFVVYKMFQKFKVVSSEESHPVRSWSGMTKTHFFWKVWKAPHEKIFERIAKVTVSKQPYV